jgi:phosphatidylglycerophosphate synthase
VRVWIDATRQDDKLKIFGMGLLERLLGSLLQAQKQLTGLKALQKELQGLDEASAYLRGFLQTHLDPTEVRIELAPGASIPANLPARLLAKLPIVFSQGEASTHERLTQALRDANGEPLLVLSADTVVDVRVLEHLIWANRPLVFWSGVGEQRGVAMRIDEPLLDTLGDGEGLGPVAEACLEQGACKEWARDEFDSYIQKLRRTLDPYLFRVPNAKSAAKVERFLFWSNYKGATDFMTKYVYPPLVWKAVVPLARRRVQPNTVTAVGMVCCFASIPFFAMGWWMPGLLLAYAMTVLDSVDGKLARVTFTSSDRGNILDHGTDLVHPPLWYFAWAWGLSGGVASAAVFQASVWMAGLYICDRLLETLFKSCTGGRSVQDYTPLDSRLRTFVSRRNVNLALFTVALPFGLGTEAFFAIVGLQLATAAYHLVRVIQFWNANEQHDAPGPRLGAAEGCSSS